MLSFAQMEKHYRLLEIIEQYKRLLSQYDISLKAVRFDGMPRAGTYQADKLGEIMIRKERAIEKLPRLEALADAEGPQVEETIKAAAGRGRDAIKIELILRVKHIESYLIIKILKDNIIDRFYTLIDGSTLKVILREKVNFGRRQIIVKILGSGL